MRDDGAGSGPPAARTAGRPRIARVGAWVASPATEAKLQVPPGRALVAVWAACGACAAEPGFHARVEALILAEAGCLRGEPHLRN